MPTLIQHAKETALTTLKKAANTEYKNPAGKAAKKAALLSVNKLLGLAIPFASRNHFKVIEIRTGYLKAKMPIKGNKNHIGTMYAGALFTVAELPGGILSILNFGSEYYPILKDLNMSYLKVVKSDVTVEFSLSKKDIARIEKESAQQGKSSFILHGELKDETGSIVAKSEAHYQVRKHH